MKRKRAKPRAKETPPPAPSEPCPRCEGKGTVSAEWGRYTVRCDDCHGSGVKDWQKLECADCGGTGFNQGTCEVCMGVGMHFPEKRA